jgi:taurine dioxygenase
MKVFRRPDFGVEVSDLSIQQASPEEAAELVSLVHHEKLLVLKGQQFDEGDYVAFAQKLGRPQIYPQPNYHHPEWPEIFVSTNIPLPDGRKFGVSGTGRYWHTDCSFLPEPLPLTMVTPRVIPRTSRGTLYIDMQRVYELLPSRLRAIVDNHDAIQEAKWRYKVQAVDIDRALIDILEDWDRRLPASIHPAVIEHPVTRKRALYISRGFTTGFRGMPYEESKRWLAELLEFVERPEHVFNKQWVAGEVLLWDNRVLLHMAAHGDPGEQNLSYRIGVFDNQPFYLAPTAASPNEARGSERDSHQEDRHVASAE